MIPVYLYVGPEFGLRNEAIEKHKIAAEKKFGTLDIISYMLMKFLLEKFFPFCKVAISLQMLVL